ncbi:MAG: hypothetical protein DI535_03025 [Citrobacter freundii]|nr:MAG: hypothetical protein DI535_03025 [Citrobacter freundii]
MQTADKQSKLSRLGFFLFLCILIPVKLLNGLLCNFKIKTENQLATPDKQGLASAGPVTEAGCLIKLILCGGN